MFLIIICFLCFIIILVSLCMFIVVFFLFMILIFSKCLSRFFSVSIFFKLLYLLIISNICMCLLMKCLKVIDSGIVFNMVIMFFVYLESGLLVLFLVCVINKLECIIKLVMFFELLFLNIGIWENFILVCLWKKFFIVIDFDILNSVVWWVIVFFIFSLCKFNKFCRNVVLWFVSWFFCFDNFVMVCSLLWFNLWSGLFFLKFFVISLDILMNGISIIERYLRKYVVIGVSVC